MTCADCGCYLSPDHKRCPNCGGDNILIHNEDGDEWRHDTLPEL